MKAGTPQVGEHPLLSPGLDHREHPFLALAEHDLVRRHRLRTSRDGVDIDGDARSVPLCRGADEISDTGIFANFTASPTVGNAPHSVTFTDATYTSDPGGVISWARRG